MFIKDADWEKIRDKFTESEKHTLRLNVVGQAICPRGNIINTVHMPPDTMAKLRKELRALGVQCD